MVYGKEMEQIDRSRTKAEALDVLAKMNAMLRKMAISEALKKERFERLQDRLNSLGWLGLCDESTFSVKADGCWTQLRQCAKLYPNSLINDCVDSNRDSA